MAPYFPLPHVSGYFLIRNFFFLDSKFSPSTRSVFKSNPPLHTHPMISWFTQENSGLHVVPPYWLFCSVRDWPPFCYLIGFQNIQIGRPHVIGFVADLFFPTLERRLKNILICCWICRMYVDGSRTLKEKLWIQLSLLEWILQNMARHFMTHKQVQADKRQPF